MLRDVFGFAEHHEKATCRLGLKNTLTRNKNTGVLNKAAALDGAKIKIDKIHWYVPQYTHSLPQKGTLAKQILNKPPMELRYIERSDFHERSK